MEFGSKIGFLTMRKNFIFYRFFLYKRNEQFVVCIGNGKYNYNLTFIKS